MPLPLARWQLPLALGAAASGGAGTWQLPTRWQLPLALGISGRQVRAERKAALVARAIRSPIASTKNEFKSNAESCNNCCDTFTKEL